MSRAIVCENCGSNDVVIQEGVYVCQYCGTQYEVADKAYIAELERKTKEESDAKLKKKYAQIAAQNEINLLKKNDRKGNRIASIIAILLGILSFVLGFNNDSALIWGGVFFLFIGIATLSGLAKGKQRVKYLENISEGKKEILLCPYCKSTDIVPQTIGGISGYICQDCKKSFNHPEKIMD